MRTQNCKEGRECARMGQMSLVGAKSTGEYKNEVRCGTDGHTTGVCMMVSDWWPGEIRKIQVSIAMVHRDTDVFRWSWMGEHGRKWIYWGGDTQKRDNEVHGWAPMCLHVCEGQQAKIVAVSARSKWGVSDQAASELGASKRSEQTSGRSKWGAINQARGASKRGAINRANYNQSRGASERARSKQEEQTSDRRAIKRSKQARGARNRSKQASEEQSTKYRRQKRHTTAETTRRKDSINNNEITTTRIHHKKQKANQKQQNKNAEPRHNSIHKPQK